MAKNGTISVHIKISLVNLCDFSTPACAHWACTEINKQVLSHSLCKNIHTHTHTYIHTHTRTHTHTHTYTYTHIHAHTHAFTHLYAHTHRRKHTPSQAQTHMRIFAYLYALARNLALIDISACVLYGQNNQKLMISDYFLC